MSAVGCPVRPVRVSPPLQGRGPGEDSWGRRRGLASGHPSSRTAALERDGDAIHRKLDEPAILADIAYFERKVSEIGAPRSSYERAMLRVYQSLLTHRRQTLAAWRDGRPDRWYEYEHVA